jgi:large subunit ribosomal protein L17
MLMNMANSLIENKRIFTTIAKAKALRQYVEPLLTKAKKNETHSRRTVFSYLQSKNAVQLLFDEIAVKIADRPGGYTRILKTGRRLGDNAEMCFIELVDYNENMLKSTEDKPKRSRRKRAKSKAQETTEESEVAVAEEKVKEQPTAKEKEPEAKSNADDQSIKEDLKESKAEAAAAEETIAEAKESAETTSKEEEDKSADSNSSEEDLDKSSEKEEGEQEDKS